MQPDETSDNIRMTLRIGRTTYTVGPRRGPYPGKGYQLCRPDGSAEVATQVADGSTHCTCAEFRRAARCRHLSALVQFGLFSP